jgi:hypothetical protein
MQAANFALRLLDGREQRTFGNTCDDVEIGEGETRCSLEPLIAELFVDGAEHRRLLDHLAAHSATILTAPLIEVASLLRG